MKLLLVEDDHLLGDGLCAALAKAGFGVTWVRDGQSALALAGAAAPESRESRESRESSESREPAEFAAIVLDLGLPGVSGFEVLRELRGRGVATPVLLLTARDSTRDKVQGLDCGADDYLVKTADMEELVARLRALVRRSGRGNKVLRAGEIALDLVAHTVHVAGRDVGVSGREFALLRALMEGSGRVLTRSHLEQTLNGWGRPIESNAIEVHIHHLRAKLGAAAIRTVRGIGYTLGKA